MSVSLSVSTPFLTPHEACAAWNAGAALVDLRTSRERDRQGHLPGALDVGSAGAVDQVQLLLTADGTGTEAAAEALRRDGFGVAAVAGGYAAWRREVWRHWGELLIAEPQTRIDRFFRQLSDPWCRPAVVPV